MNKFFYAGLIAAMTVGTNAFAHEGEDHRSAQSGSQQDQQISQAGSGEGMSDGQMTGGDQQGQQAAATTDQQQPGQQQSEQQAQAGSELETAQRDTVQTTQAQQDEKTQRGEMMGQQTGQQARAQQEQVAGTKEPRQVSGQIIQMKEIAVRGTDARNRVVMLKTNKNDRRVVVDLGPTSGLQDVQLKEGNEIAVSGPVVEIRDRTFLVANKLKANGKTVDIERTPQEQQHAQRAQQQQRAGGEQQQTS